MAAGPRTERTVGELPVSFHLLALVDMHRGVAFLPFGRIRQKTAKPLSYEPEPRTIGQHIRKRRFELGLFQKEVAVLLKVDPWTIVNWERDRTRPPLRFIPRIIDFLGFDPFPEPQTFGEQLLAGRRRLGLSQKHVARRLGIDEGTVAKWENGARRPSGLRMQGVVAFLASED